MESVTFAVGLYDALGEKYDSKISIFIDDNLTIRFKNLPELIKFKIDIEKCIKEINENYLETKMV